MCSKRNGIAGAAQRVSVGARQVSQNLAFSRCVEVECADGRRGGKLKTRKVRFLESCANLSSNRLESFNHLAVLRRPLQNGSRLLEVGK